jgi:hypothetical protein
MISIILSGNGGADGCTTSGTFSGTSGSRIWFSIESFVDCDGNTGFALVVDVGCGWDLFACSSAFFLLHNHQRKKAPTAESTAEGDSIPIAALT